MYRSENTGIELARDVLKEAVLEDYTHLPEIELELEMFGFRKEQPLPHSFIGPILNYSRETADGLELLVDRDLANPFDKTVHLYKLQEGADIQEWYESIPLEDMKHRKMTASLMAIAASAFGGAGAILVDNGFGLFLAALAGISVGVSYNSARPVLSSQTLAKGREALRYIADKNPEQAYTSKKRMRIIDDEFGIDEQAEENKNDFQPKIWI